MTGPREGYRYTRLNGRLVRTTDKGIRRVRWEDAPEDEAPPELAEMTLAGMLRLELMRFVVTDTGSPDRKHCGLCQQWLSGYHRATATGHKDDCLLVRGDG